MSDRETVFTLEATPVKFGPGAADDAGWELARLGVTRALLVTDPGRRRRPGIPSACAPRSRRPGSRSSCSTARGSSRRSTRSRRRRRSRATRGVDGFVSVGGGSSIDTAKVADLIVSHPAPVMDYVNPPVGEGRKPPAPLRPHLAIPTTSGTGSEATTVAVLDIPELRVKTGISHRYLRPAQAIVDPDLARTAPREVTASSGLDVVCHAAESLLVPPVRPARRARRRRTSARPTRARTRSPTSGRRRRWSTAAASCAARSPTPTTSRRAAR